MMDWISNSGKAVLLSRGFRSFGYGFIGILTGIYLDELGFPPLYIGILLSAALIGGVAFTLITGRYVVKFGLKRMLILSLIVSLIGIFTLLLTNNFVFLIFAFLIGFISPSGREVGPLLSLEQAYLPFTVDVSERTRVFSVWNIIATFCMSIGALFAAFPDYLQGIIGLDRMASFKLMFILYFLLNFISLILYARISEVRFEKTRVELSRDSRDIITKLSLLFVLDSLGGGLIIMSILSLWFYTRFNASITVISAMFFVGGLLETLSYYLSARLAKRIGLIRTMVFTHIPSNIFLILIPFMPSFYLSALCYFLRQVLSEMDIPARQSYVVAMVKPEEKAVATSTTNVARVLASSVGPLIAGNLVLLGAFVPFVLAGSMKIVYDLGMYVKFKDIKPPEEK